VNLDALLKRVNRRLRRSPADQGVRLRAQYRALMTLTAANNAALEIFGDLQRASSGDLVFDARFVRDAATRALARGREVVDALAVLAGEPPARLSRRLERLGADVGAILDERDQVAPGPAVLPFAEAHAAPAGLVGGKVKRLAELRAILGIPAPDGFVITSAACHRLLSQQGLWQAIQHAVDGLAPVDRQSLAQASEAIRQRILATAWPAPLAAAILDAYDDLVRRQHGGSPVLVSVRSSAADEDGAFSFAGQYVSILNVTRDRLLEASKEVVASQFGPRAVIYYKTRGLDSAALPMAIGIVAMVDARASGVLYTRAPDAPDADTMIVSGSWGLGPSTVDGRVSPDVFRVRRDPPHDLADSRVAAKERMLLARPEGGTVEVEVPGWMRDRPCLTREQLAALAGYAARLERHYGAPQDVEWAVDALDRTLVLQSRPLRVRPRSAAAAGGAVAARKGLAVLLGGAVASSGVASGPVVLVRNEAEVEVPPGAVIVAHTAAPALAALIDRAAAVVTEVGSLTSHLATVARESRVPALFGAREAMSRLRDGETVTVDAEMGNVYAGRVEALLAAAAGRERDPALLETPLFRRLRAVARLLTPLNLTDPRSRAFRPDGCRTLHDILRYAHETAVREMFLAGNAAGAAGGSLRLDSPLPVNLFVVDLGGGLAVEPEATTVTPQQFRSRPLAALWAGLAAVPWSTAPAAGGARLGSVMLTALTTPEAAGPEPDFALVSDVYLNVQFRFGYHFARLDAIVAPGAPDTYATLVFHGGAADAAGRSRRLDFLAAVLEDRGWRVSRRADALLARVDALPEAEMAQELDLAGRLLVVTRQIDTRLATDAATAAAVAAFRSGDYSLALDGGSPRGEGDALVP
jgi:pyruvate,water dikinase